MSCSCPVSQWSAWEGEWRIWRVYDVFDLDVYCQLATIAQFRTVLLAAHLTLRPES
jgi:hypothetical protein